MNEIQDQGLNGLLAKRLNTDVGPAPALAPEIFPVFPVADYTPEFDFPLGVMRARGSARSAAVAGNLSFVALTNPENSGVICFTRRQMTSVGGAGSVLWHLMTAAPAIAAIQSSSYVDTRAPAGLAVVGGATRVLLTAGNQVAVVGKELIRMGAGINSFTQFTFILAPNSSLVVFSSVANVALDASFEWFERRAQPQEL